MKSKFRIVIGVGFSGPNPSSIFPTNPRNFR